MRLVARALVVVGAGLFLASAADAASFSVFMRPAPDRFSPTSLTIAVNDSVTWFNDAPQVHFVTIPSLGIDQDVQNNKPFTYQFKVAGTYSYYCSRHPNMTGLVQVAAPAPTTAPPTTAPTATPRRTAAPVPSAAPSTPAPAAPSSTTTPSATPAPESSEPTFDDGYRYAMPETEGLATRTASAGQDLNGLFIALFVLAAAAGGFWWWLFAWRRRKKKPEAEQTGS